MASKDSQKKDEGQKPSVDTSSYNNMAQYNLSHPIKTSADKVAPIGPPSDTYIML